MLLLLTALAAVLPAGLPAQPRQPFSRVQVGVTPDRNGWTYAVGERVAFHVTVTRDGFPVTGAEVTYAVGPEMLAPVAEGTLTVGAAPLRVEADGLREPGFVRLVATTTVDGIAYRGVGTAGVAPESIQPTQANPPDFDAFWDEGRRRLATVPVEARRTLLPDYGTATVDCWHVELLHAGVPDGTSRLFGVLCEPKAPGRYPALLGVPGAGVRPYRGLVRMAERGIITFQIGIHGLPVVLDPPVYDALGAGALRGYPTFALDDRDRYYYRRVYLATLRANDYLTSLPAWDGRNLGVTGGSQGGALAIVTAGLDARVTALAAYYPALSDVTGYLHGRAGGWPHMFRAAEGSGAHRTPEKIATSAYYDVVNFARRVRAPGFYSWGYNDETCPPTSMYAAYNVITAPKTLRLALDTGHRTSQEQVDVVDDWLVAQLRGPAPGSAAARP